MLITKNSKNSIIKSIALILAILMMASVALVGCTDENAQATADEAKAAADAAKAAADAAAAAAADAAANAITSEDLADAIATAVAGISTVSKEDVAAAITEALAKSEAEIDVLKAALDAATKKIEELTKGLEGVVEGDKDLAAAVAETTGKIAVLLATYTENKEAYSPDDYNAIVALCEAAKANVTFAADAAAVSAVYTKLVEDLKAYSTFVDSLYLMTKNFGTVTVDSKAAVEDLMNYLKVVIESEAGKKYANNTTGNAAFKADLDKLAAADYALSVGTVDMTAYTESKYEDNYGAKIDLIEKVFVIRNAYVAAVTAKITKEATDFNKIFTDNNGKLKDLKALLPSDKATVEGYQTTYNTWKSGVDALNTWVGIYGGTSITATSLISQANFDTLNAARKQISDLEFAIYDLTVTKYGSGNGFYINDQIDAVLNGYTPYSRYTDTERGKFGDVITAINQFKDKFSTVISLEAGSKTTAEGVWVRKYAAVIDLLFPRYNEFQKAFYETTAMRDKYNTFVGDGGIASLVAGYNGTYSALADCGTATVTAYNDVVKKIGDFKKIYKYNENGTVSTTVLYTIPDSMMKTFFTLYKEADLARKVEKTINGLNSTIITYVDTVYTPVKGEIEAFNKAIEAIGLSIDNKTFVSVKAARDLEKEIKTWIDAKKTGANAYDFDSFINQELLTTATTGYIDVINKTINDLSGQVSGLKDAINKINSSGTGAATDAEKKVTNTADMTTINEAYNLYKTFVQGGGSPALQKESGNAPNFSYASIIDATVIAKLTAAYNELQKSLDAAKAFASAVKKLENINVADFTYAQFNSENNDDLYLYELSKEAIDHDNDPATAKQNVRVYNVKVVDALKAAKAAYDAFLTENDKVAYSDVTDAMTITLSYASGTITFDKLLTESYKADAINALKAAGTAGEYGVYVDLIAGVDDATYAASKVAIDAYIAQFNAVNSKSVTVVATAG